MALPRRILVADDDADLRVILTIALEMEGYAVSAAPDGLAALALVAAEPPAVIILDLRMPGLSGWDVAAALKEGGVSIPTLVLTAVPDPAAAAREVGAAGYLAKPFEIDELLAKVARLCPPA